MNPGQSASVPRYSVTPGPRQKMRSPTQTWIRWTSWPDERSRSATLAKRRFVGPCRKRKQRRPREAMAVGLAGGSGLEELQDALQFLANVRRRDGLGYRH